MLIFEVPLMRISFLAISKCILKQRTRRASLPIDFYEAKVKFVEPPKAKWTQTCREAGGRRAKRQAGWQDSLGKFV